VTKEQNVTIVISRNFVVISYSRFVVFWLFRAIFEVFSLSRVRVFSKSRGELTKTRDDLNQQPYKPVL